MSFTEKQLLSVFRRDGFFIDEATWVNAPVLYETDWAKHRGQWDKEIVFAIDDDLYSFIVKKRHCNKRKRFMYSIVSPDDQVYQISNLNF